MTSRKLTVEQIAEALAMARQTIEKLTRILSRTKNQTRRFELGNELMVAEKRFRELAR
jgi:hypothetical protein